MLTLSDILDIQGLVLVDTGIVNGGRFRESFFRRIYYDSLNKGFLESQIKTGKEFIQLMQDPKTRVIPEVSREIRDFFNKVKNKVRGFEENYETFYHGPENKRTFQKKPNKRAKKNRNKVTEMQEDFESIRGYLPENELHITDPRYRILTQMIITLDKAIKLKRSRRDSGKPSDTDEKLVAALYMHSLSSDSPPCLLTRDTDFTRLLGATPRLLGSEVFLPYNRPFRQALERNPFGLYMKHDDGYDHAFGEINFDNGFNLTSISPTFRKKVQQQISSLWKEFSEH